MNARTSMAQRDDVIRRTVYVSDLDQQVFGKHFSMLVLSKTFLIFFLCVCVDVVRSLKSSLLVCLLAVDRFIFFFLFKKKKLNHWV